MHALPGWLAGSFTVVVGLAWMVQVVCVVKGGGSSRVVILLLD